MNDGSEQHDDSISNQGAKGPTPNDSDGLNRTRALDALEAAGPRRDNEGGKSNSSASLIGTRLGDYQVMRKLGRGGMAEVYAARHLSLGRDVALKVLRSELARDKDYVERFRREARSAAKLSHPNIVQVFDVGNVDSTYYIAQELVDGPNLREVLERGGAISLDEAIEVLVGVASALEVAAEAGITHRDIKPENIMRSSRGIVKVADFGLARLGTGSDASRADLTQAGLTLGTPRYMSPEQVQGQPVDVRSDLYSLGVSIYHLLAGRPPFEADDPLALAVMHLHETPSPLDRVRNRRDAEGNPDLPEWLVAVISRLMNKLPQDRFQTPSELLDAIRNQASTSSLAGLGAGVGTAAATIRLQRAADQARRVRRRRRRRLVVAILLPIVLTGLVATAGQQKRGKSVTELLRPETVNRAETVQEQYLNAVTRNDEPGWRSVGEYFPPQENSTNANYHAKSMFQLARMLAAEGRHADAAEVLTELLGEPNIDLVYQVIAQAQRCLTLQHLGKSQQLTEARQQLQSMYAELKPNVAAVQLVERVFSESERLQLGLGATGNGT